MLYLIRYCDKNALSGNFLKNLSVDTNVKLYIKVTKQCACTQRNFTKTIKSTLEFIHLILRFLKVCQKKELRGNSDITQQCCAGREKMGWE